MAALMKDKEAYQRLNFLYQAAHCVLSQNPENTELARFYCFTQKTITKRLVLKQDPSVKRTICKRCCSPLIPGVTATTRQRRNKRKTRFTVMRCLSCGQSKTLLNDPEYSLWVDRPEAQLENQKQTDQVPKDNKKNLKNKKGGQLPPSQSSASTQQQQELPSTSGSKQD
ncbi:ribonuclease P protein subunit p21 [Cheilinus undulatus]|uniref:ribonuclease P protein subunit p21 n=1 Tax=Cheilinus undulatus TaxID=241271 RepID=UPI001BD1F704|nr:ribonuclease P protein subunit p21 [Cheilinus undulatus]